MTAHVVTNGRQFLAWDDKGAMSTGYPMWVDIERAKIFTTRSSAEASAMSAKRCGTSMPAFNVSIFVQGVDFVLGSWYEVILPEDDPEWAEYERLKKKFGGK